MFSANVLVLTKFSLHWHYFRNPKMVVKAATTVPGLHGLQLSTKINQYNAILGKYHEDFLNYRMSVYPFRSSKVVQLLCICIYFCSSRITDVNLETEPSLTLVQLNKQVKDTAWLINHFIDQEISSSNRNSSFTFVVFTASNKVSGEN